MPAERAQAVVRHSPDVLERRIHGILRRTMARAEKDAEAARKRAAEVSDAPFLARQLKAVEAGIRELSRDAEELSPYGRQELKEAKEYRKQLRERIAEL